MLNKSLLMALTISAMSILSLSLYSRDADSLDMSARGLGRLGSHPPANGHLAGWHLTGRCDSGLNEDTWTDTPYVGEVVLAGAAESHDKPAVVQESLITPLNLSVVRAPRAEGVTVLGNQATLKPGYRFDLIRPNMVVVSSSRGGG